MDEETQKVYESLIDYINKHVNYTSDKQAIIGLVDKIIDLLTENTSDWNF